jgi:hypothetical protein
MVSINKGLAMAQEVSRRPLATAARVRIRFSPCEICGDKVAMGQVFLRVFRVFSVHVIPSWLPTLIYYLENDTASSHRNEQHEQEVKHKEGKHKNESKMRLSS